MCFFAIFDSAVKVYTIHREENIIRKRLSGSFVDEIKEAKKNIYEATTKYRLFECEKASKYSIDLALDSTFKAKLMGFVRDNELDKSLCELWQEIESLSVHSELDNEIEHTSVIKIINSSESFEPHDPLNYKMKSITFTRNFKWYKLSVRRRYDDRSTDKFEDIVLYENDEEVFGVSYLISNIFKYKFGTVTAFKTKGEWAKNLLYMFGQIQIRRNENKIQ